MLEDLSTLSFQSLRVFAQVSLLGSVSAAAKKLSVTQPAVSLQLANLEKQLGFPLFEKTGRRLILNSKGQVFFERILPILESMNRIVQDARTRERVLRPSLHMGAVEGIGESWLAHKIKKFFTQHQDLRLQLDIKESDDLEKMLLSGDLALIVSNRRLEDPRVVSFVLVQETWVPIARQELITRLSEEISQPRRNKGFWEKFNWIGYGDRNHFDPWALRWFESVGVKVDRGFRYTHRVNSYAIIKELISSGMGICVGPKHAFALRIQKGDFVTFENEKFPGLHRNTYLSYREDSLSGIAEEFRLFISQGIENTN